MTVWQCFAVPEVLPLCFIIFRKAYLISFVAGRADSTSPWNSTLSSSCLLTCLFVWMPADWSVPSRCELFYIKAMQGTTTHQAPALLSHPVIAEAWWINPLRVFFSPCCLSFRLWCILHFTDSGEQQEERLVRRVLGGELQLQTDELLQEGRQQQEVYGYATPHVTSSDQPGLEMWRLIRSSSFSFTVRRSHSHTGVSLGCERLQKRPHKKCCLLVGELKLPSQH